MKIITNTYYQANDGTAFDTQDDCEEYEQECERLIAADELDALFSEAKGMYGSFGSFVSSNYDKIKEIMEDTPEVESEVDWSKVPSGNMILVKEHLEDYWVERNFLFLAANGKYACSAKGDFGIVDYWTLAKLKD